MRPKFNSFYGDQAIKDKHIARMKEHMRLDQLVKGTGFYKKTGKGCAVGCTLDNYSHYAYETELSIPFTLAVLEENIFEGLFKKEALSFPLEFLEAIPVGKDLGNIYNKFSIWEMIDELDGFIAKMKTDDEKKLCIDIASFHQKIVDGIETYESDWKNIADR